MTSIWFKNTVLALGLIGGLAACDSVSTASDTPQATAQNADQVTANEITFKATDGGDVVADLYLSTAGKDAPLIMLFHQAGANGRSEYENITPKLVAQGFNILQVDQRSGGGYYGHSNRTVKARGKSATFCPAYADLEGALAFAKSQGFAGKKYVWGSSYSAALVLKLGGEHGSDLAGVLSFSPGIGPAMGACHANQYISALNTQALILRPRHEMNAAGKEQQELAKKNNVKFFISEDGVHGSSTLDASRAKGGVEESWAQVWSFLDVTP
jgi:alpha-beta hydrolase superfamily lysophospholipase